MTVPAEDDVVVRVCPRILPVPLGVLPVMPAVADEVHAKVAPAGVDESVTKEVIKPEQTVWGVTGFTTGVGFTFTVAVAVPEQPNMVPVTV